MIETIVGLLTSSGIGSIVGVVGGWMTKVEERKNLKLKFEHEENMTNIQKDINKQDAEIKLKILDKGIEQSVIDGKIKQDIADTEAFKTGLEVQKIMTGIKWVDSIRMLMRPIITTYLLAISSVVSYNIYALVGGLNTLDPVELLSIYKNIITQVMFLTTMSISWWFSARPSQSKVN